VTGILFGLLPALKALRVEVLPAMESGGRGSAGSQSDMRRGLVLAETVLAVLLLTGAGLLAKSFWRLIHISSGLSPERTLSVWLPIPDWKYPDEKADHYRDRLLARLRTVPGVLAVGASKTMPLAGGGEPYVFRADGRASTSEPFTPASGALIVTPGYFAALGIPILRGRGFTEQDMSASAPVLVVNQTLARELWPGQEAVGKALRVGRTRFQVIGVAADVRHEGLPHRPGTAIYVPMSRFPRSSLKVFLRTARDPGSLAAAVRAAVHDLEPDQPVSDMLPLSDVVDASVLRSRFYASTLGIFAGLALLLAGSGLYAVLSYRIARRTREIGVRMALGAGRREVLLLVAREGIGSCAAGILIGLVLSAAATRLLGSLLFDVRPLDPLVFGLVPLFLLTVAAIASCAPALRAARVDPIRALRSE
jgi:predicted permease